MEYKYELVNGLEIDGLSRELRQYYKKWEPVPGTNITNHVEPIIEDGIVKDNRIIYCCWMRIDINKVEGNEYG